MSFFWSRLPGEWLGFKIDANGLHATGQKLDALLEAPIPTSVQQLRSFLGLVHELLFNFEFHPKTGNPSSSFECIAQEKRSMAMV